MSETKIAVITGNELRTGDVIWWTGEGWSRHVNDAVEAGEHAEAIIARFIAATSKEASVRMVPFTAQALVTQRSAWTSRSCPSTSSPAQEGSVPV